MIEEEEPNDEMRGILDRIREIGEAGERAHARGERTLGDIFEEAIEAKTLGGPPERITVPTIQGNWFSHNARWARAVKAEVDRIDTEYSANTENQGTQIDRTWVVLMALPGALKAFDGEKA